MIPGARCGHPVKAYELSRHGEAAPGGLFTPCWRPAGHNGGHHLSRSAYERELRRKADWASARWARLRQERELAPCGTPAAARRHRRHGEVPCEACRAAENADITVSRRARRQQNAELAA